MGESRWLLPDGMEEILPEAASRLEDLRRQLLDLYRSWGYELVIPPFIEYLESLLTGTGTDLDIQTFKLTDQLTGRTMGVRADMTPQVARIESVVLKRNEPVRLCYLGTVLRTRSLESGGSRSPLQIGAELYGHHGPESDVEVISLAVESLKTAGVDDVLLDLGHVGIFRGLVQDAGLSTSQEAILFDILQRKSVPELEQFLKNNDIIQSARTRLAVLCSLNGEIENLPQAAVRLQGAGEQVQQSLQALQSVADLLLERIPGLNLHFDLAELRGYHYHTGVVFAAYSIGHGKAIAQGGRYDNIGRDFGVSRPATGFSADLKQWVQLSGWNTTPCRPGILAPWDNDPQLQKTITRLRAKGERVIQNLANQSEVDGCDRHLVKRGEAWEIASLPGGHIHPSRVGRSTEQ